MKIKTIFLLITVLIYYSCSTNEEPNSAAINMHEAVCSCDGCLKVPIFIDSLGINELYNTNRRLSKSIKEDFRSWKTNETERWGYLSQKFADEVIAANPTAKLNRKKIEGVFAKYLAQQALIEKADTKDKHNLKIKANNEFRFSLTYEIGLVEYNNWQKLTQANFKQYKELQDSLKMVIVVQTERLKQNQKKK